MRFGHQVSAPTAGRRAHRHIPNPNVSLGHLQDAAMKWVGGWDDDDEDDFESAHGSDALAPLDSAGSIPSLAPHFKGGSDARASFASLGTPLGVLPEESSGGDALSAVGAPSGSGM